MNLSFSKDTKVYLMELKGEVNSVMNRYVQLGFKEARKDSADIILFEMSTYGGGVLDADSISQRILKSEIPVWVLINGNAGSAGAFISISCDSIFMTPASVMGASTVINQNVEVMPEKIQSYMRKKMKAAAEQSKRDPAIAMSMVGHNLQTDSAFVLTLTTQEAIDTGYCEGEFDSVDDLLKAKVNKYKVENFILSKREGVIAFFLSPGVKGVLILLILAGLYFEFQTPGIGFPILVSVLATILYFVPDYLHGFLDNWEIAVFVIGLLLVILEIFVIPGFGVAGIAGIFFILSSLILSMLKNDFFDFTLIMPSKIEVAVLMMAISSIGLLIIFFTGSFALARSKTFKERIAVSEVMNASAVRVEKSNLINQKGIALSVLRPSGKIEIEGRLYDAEAKNGFIDKSAKVEVVNVKGNVLEVKIIE